MKKNRPLSRVAKLIAKDLRDFGYPNITDQMIVDIWRAMQDGKTGFDLPHGVIGMFAERSINEAVDVGLVVVDDLKEPQ